MVEVDALAGIHNPNRPLVGCLSDHNDQSKGKICLWTQKYVSDLR